MTEIVTISGRTYEKSLIEEIARKENTSVSSITSKLTSSGKKSCFTVADFK